MKPKWMVALVVLAVVAAVAAVAIRLSKGEPTEASTVAPAAGGRAHVEARKAGESTVDERRAAHRAEVEARSREYEAFRKMSPEEQRQFREQKREEQLAHRRESRSKQNAGKSVQMEQEELRAAAIKARTEYEDSMRDEATGEMSANYRRRSVSYWMNRVKRQRERAADRGHRSHAENFGVDAGASAADNQKQEAKGKTE